MRERPTGIWLPTRAALAVMALAACGQPSQPARQQTDATARPPGARRLDVTSLDANRLPAAILDECHKPLRTRMQQVKVRVTLRDQRHLEVQADLPSRFRVQDGKRKLLLRDGEAYAMDAASPITGSEEQLLRQLATIVDAAAFGPLHRATSCRADSDGYILRTSEGATATMQLHEDSLLPCSLTVHGTTVQVGSYLRTRTSWVVNQVSTEALGPCDVYFEDGGVIFGRGFFDPPAATTKAETTGKTKPVIRIAKPGTVREIESPTPIIVQGKAERWVVLKDPANWQARHLQYEPVYRELDAQNQRIAGFPILFAEQNQEHLAVPFRQRKGGEELSVPNGWQIREKPRSRLLLVYPDSGSIAERIDTGTELLQRAIANRKLRTLGPILAQPFVHLHKGPPDDDKLAECKVRMSVRIE